MLVFGEEAITFYMLHNMLSNDGFYSFVYNAGETNRSIVAGQASRSFFCVLVLFWLVSMTQLPDSIPTLAQCWFNVVHYDGPWPAYNLGPV